jgi:hypothetical protein
MQIDPKIPEKSEDGRPGKTPVTALQRAGRVGLDLINPFSDLIVIYRTGVQPTVARFKSMREMMVRRAAAQESLSWEEAVRRAGKPVDQLQKTFKITRGLWWALMAVPGILAVMLLVMLAATKLDLPSVVLLRACIAELVLATLSAVGFVKALIATYRLWQLQTQRVSEEERGTFKDFLSETRWCRQVLTLA